ncbi:MAG: hypothetical protein GTO51_02230 [Candidatus Latescibacteria bacterium]|nr:hypothetical protein [Candidatus Latescibacterota bacterium]NIM22431.1 hypothetical protein [Candidatus Latescibacterota bacterium]NIM64791.1 hypothetical protein [Candidatus Latescibacterota bacterium]NIO01302.1 hypothetical protein [Candidatus Latescibacterota bacterium]NIO27794.1 hypothetical protein [Candidatus Latescibacterota bacterium]
MRCLRCAVLVCVQLTSLPPALPSGVFSAKPLLASLTGVAQAERLPIEPEEDNSEYILDLETNAYSRLWREIWDDEDNRLRLRLGSNNVRDWFIEEELKWTGTSTFLSHSRENIRDHRFYIAYEYHFGPDKAVRIIESIDLDSEDWGQFSIHDHGFFQMQFGF